MREAGRIAPGFFFAAHNDCSDAAIITLTPQSGMDEGGEILRLMKNPGRE
jgi:hypothetical protein